MLCFCALYLLIKPAIDKMADGRTLTVPAVMSMGSEVQPAQEQTEREHDVAVRVCCVPWPAAALLLRCAALRFVGGRF